MDVDDDVKYKSNGIILDTDPVQIKRFIKKCNTKLIIICTYQSSDRLAEACGYKIIFDLGIFDEAHKTEWFNLRLWRQGKTVSNQSNRQFTRMLDNKNMLIRKRLFMTATPKMYHGKVEDDKIMSMDNRNVYGDKVFTYNSADGIHDGYLVDYQVLSVFAIKKDIENDIKKNKLVKYKDEFANTEANYLAIVLVL